MRYASRNRARLCRSTSVRKASRSPASARLTAEESLSSIARLDYARPKRLVTFAFSALKSAGFGFPEARQRLALVLENLEDRVELGDLQQILRPPVQIHQLQPSTAAGHVGVSRNQFPQPARIDEIHIAQVQQNLLASLHQRFLDPPAQAAGR